MLAVELRGVEKEFKGGVKALRGVDLQVECGKVFGIIGPNGSGKTTMLRILSTLLKPTRGIVRVLGIDALKKPEKVRERIAYLPEEAGVYERLTGWENLYYYAMIYARDRNEAIKMARRGSELSGLGKDIERLAGEYSRGMKRRLALARTLMVNPELAILDEATTGLDVFSSLEIRRTIKNFVKENRSTVIVSTHNMLEAEKLCDEVALIYKGKIILKGPPTKLREQYNAESLEEAFVIAVEEAT